MVTFEAVKKNPYLCLTAVLHLSPCFIVGVLSYSYFFQVSELVVKYDREHLTVWGNARNKIVKKCYKEVI